MVKETATKYSLKQLLARAFGIEAGSEQITIPVSDSNLVDFTEIQARDFKVITYVGFVAIRRLDDGKLTEEDLKRIGW